MNAADERRALLSEILANPADDTPRLVFADWLQEHGEEARAEFIRVQCRRAHRRRVAADYDQRRKTRPFMLPYGGHCDCIRLLEQDRPCPHCWDGARERKLIEDRGYGWCDGFVGDAKTRGIGKDGATVTVDYIFPTGRGTNAMWLTFERGFFQRIEVSAADWLAHCDAILAQHPVERITLTDRPNCSSTTTHERFSGALSAGACERLVTRPRDVWLDTLERFESDRARAMLALVWPRITFTLPA